MKILTALTLSFCLSVVSIFAGKLPAEELTLYPSPSDEVVHLTNLNQEVCKIEIEDPVGLKVVSSGVDRDSPTVDVSSLKDGVYLLKCYNVFDELIQKSALVKDEKINAFVSSN